MKAKSNSKLKKFEKAAFKDMKKFNPNVQFAIVKNTTIAFSHVGELVEFATAICADNEKKFRPKVGKYYALMRFDRQQTVKLNHADFYNTIQDNNNLC
jgi:hypothetical protein